MPSTKFFPIGMIVMAVAASVIYGAAKDWRHAIYWAAAAVITASVTF